MCDEQIPPCEGCNKVSPEVLQKIVRRHMVAAFGAGLVPLPFIDIAAIAGVELNLVRKLAGAFGVPFWGSAVQGIISSLLGGAVPAMVGPSLASLVKAIPILGFPLGIATAPGVAAAMTYAIGQVFIRHFEANGTLLTFDVGHARQYFKQMCKRGADEASHMDLTKEDEPVADVEEASPAPAVEQPPTTPKRVRPSEKPEAKSDAKAAPAKRAAKKRPAADSEKKTATKKSPQTTQKK